MGPWASSETWALVSGIPNRFFTNLSNCIVVVVVVLVPVDVVVVFVVADVVAGVVLLDVITVVGAKVHVPV